MNQDKGKKQLILRLSPSLHRDLVAWAEDDFRSLNGQIEFLLTQALRKRRKGAAISAEELSGEKTD